MTTDEKPLVVLAGPIHPAGVELLQREARVAVVEDLTEEGVIRASREARAILFKSKPRVTERLMASCPQLICVGRHGVGLDIVDLQAATRLGIAVVHAPGANSSAVAEHTLMLILALKKKLLPMDRATRRREWGWDRFRGVTELRGTTLGIIGVGNVGRRVAPLAQAFGMRVLGYDPYVPPGELKRRGVEPVSDLGALLRQADIVTCHTPLTAETRHMINRTTIAQMKDGAIVIDTSRGPVHDEGALLEALASGKLKGAGIDVWEEEPPRADNPLLGLNNVVCTAHVAGVTEETSLNIATRVAGEILRVLRGEKPTALGNPDLWPKLTHLR